MEFSCVHRAHRVVGYLSRSGTPQPKDFMHDLELRIMILSASGTNGSDLALPRTPLASGGINPVWHQPPCDFWGYQNQSIHSV